MATIASASIALMGCDPGSESTDDSPASRIAQTELSESAVPAESDVLDAAPKLDRGVMERQRVRARATVSRLEDAQSQLLAKIESQGEDIAAGDLIEQLDDEIAIARAISEGQSPGEARESISPRKTPDYSSYWVMSPEGEPVPLTLESRSETVWQEPDGDDVASVCDAGMTTWQGGDGNDVQHSIYNDVCLAGMGGDDALYPSTVNHWWFQVHPVNHIVAGGDGSDFMGSVRQGGPHRFHGGNGDDVILSSDHHDVIHAGSGDDEITANFGDDYCAGGDGEDRITTNEGNDEAHGGNGADVIWLGRGNDLAFGGADNDIIVGEWDNDELHGEGGNDAIQGGLGDDLIIGGDGDDDLEGNEHDDRIEGGEGADILRGGSGNDHLVPGLGLDQTFGDDGDDVIELNSPCTARGETIDGGAGHDVVLSPVDEAGLIAAGVTLVSIEEVQVVAESDESDRGECFTDENGDLVCECCEDELADPGSGCGELPCRPGEEGACGDRGTCMLLLGGGTACDCKSGYVGPECEGSIREIRKDLAAPPIDGDFKLQQLPDLANLGERSFYTVKSISLENTTDGCEDTLTMEVEDSGTMMFGWSNLHAGNMWNIDVQGPDGSEVTISEADDWGTVISLPGGEPDPTINPEARVREEEKLSSNGYVFDAPNAGTYTVKVSAPVDDCDELSTVSGSFYFSNERAARRGLYVHETRWDSTVGQEVGVALFVYDASLEVEEEPDDGSGTNASERSGPAPLTGEIQSIEAELTGSIGIADLEFFDDGAHQDGEANDGVFGATFVPTEFGLHSVWLTVTAVNQETGSSYSRSKMFPINVGQRKVYLDESADRNASLLVEYDTPWDISFNNVESDVPEENGDPEAFYKPVDIVIPLRAEDVSSKETIFEAASFEFFVGAELWAREKGDASGSWHPISWIGGYNTPTPVGRIPDSGEETDVVYEGDLIIRLTTAGQWFLNIEANHDVSAHLFDYSLRNVRIQNGEDSLPISMADEIPIDVFPEDTAHLWLSRLRGTPLDPNNPGTAHERRIAEEMLNGIPPEFLDDLEEELFQYGFPELHGRVMFVGGYCGRSSDWTTDWNKILAHLDDTTGRQQVLSEKFAFFDAPFAGVKYSGAGYVPDKSRPLYQVSVERMAGEIAYAIGTEEGREASGFDDIASLWGMSQGASASLWAHTTTHSTLDFYKGKEHGEQVVKTLTGQFYGTSGESLPEAPVITGAVAGALKGAAGGPMGAVGGALAGALSGAVLSSIGADIGAKKIRKDRDCKLLYTNIGTDDLPVYVPESVGLTPKDAAARMANVPKHIRESLYYGRGIHEPKFFDKPWCHFVSSMMIAGKDDAVTQDHRAQVSEGTSVIREKRTCHRPASEGMQYRNIREDGRVMRAMCQGSLLDGLQTGCPQ